MVRSPGCGFGLLLGMYCLTSIRRGRPEYSFLAPRATPRIWEAGMTRLLITHRSDDMLKSQGIRATEVDSDETAE